MDWQPIETAPKDGTSVLLFPGDSVDITIGWFSKEFSSSPGVWKSIEKESNYDILVPIIIKPTHWMPLPEPPK